jgi:hypothetical protein
MTLTKYNLIIIINNFKKEKNKRFVKKILIIHFRN